MAADTSNFNFQGIGVVTAFTVIGCTNPLAFNFNPNATVDDGSCVDVIEGCMDPLTCIGSYNLLANTDDGSCDYCCPTYSIPGCNDPTACNYDPTATCDDGSCTGILGCMDDDFAEYNASATCDDNLCIDLLGCTDPTASNYDPLATVDDPSNPCITCVDGCMDCGTLWEIDNTATCPGGAATLPGSVNFDPSATCDDGSCLNAIYGCTDLTADNYNSFANVDDGSCVYTILGCTDLTANNYNSSATYDDGSCVYLGCMDPLATNYDVSANTDDGSCIYLGCTDPTACNFDPGADVDDGSCDLPNGCGDALYLEYDPLVTCSDASACITLIVNGCMDALADNYDASATVDDGSCTYTSNYTYIPDLNFRTKLNNSYSVMSWYDAIGTPTPIATGEYCMTSDINTIVSVNVNNEFIANLTGIEDFAALTTLNCDQNQLTSLDISQNTALTWLYCNYNQLTSLDVSNNTALIDLSCGVNQLTTFDLSNHLNLEYANLAGNPFTTNLNLIDAVTGSAYNPNLGLLNLNECQQTSLDVTNNIALVLLTCHNNDLTSLDVSNNTALTSLDCSGNQLTSLDVTANTSLNMLRVGNNKLNSLDLRNGHNILRVRSVNNDNLLCVSVHDVGFANVQLTVTDPLSASNNSYWMKDSWTSYSLSC